MNLIEKAKSFLAGRKRDYHVVFAEDNLAARRVLADLAQFCRAHETSFHKDERIDSLLEGRREVWLRIQQHLNLSNDDLWKLYGRKE